MVAEAEGHFPVRIRIGVPQDGLGSRLDQIKAWLGHNCGTNGWAITPGSAGVLRIEMLEQLSRLADCFVSDEFKYLTRSASASSFSAVRNRISQIAGLPARSA